jgi:alpha-1,6-mannosyltransferase
LLMTGPMPSRSLHILSGFLYGAALLALGYFVPRSAFWTLFPIYTLLFALYLLWVKGRPALDLKGILLLGVLFRLLLMGMVPNWSDDVARFIWDGRIVANGGDPYGMKPSKLLGTKEAERMGLDSALFESLNSPDYYSVYPPVEQYAFGLSSWIAGEDAYRNIVLLRSLLFLADLAVALALMRLLASFGRDRKAVGLYFLNPLVILEGVGNLHFEVLMIAFLLWGFYWALQKREAIRSGLLFAASISCKLIPLIFMPFFLRTHRWRALLIHGVAGLALLLSFLPWLSVSGLQHFATSLNLYFQSFEFNGSIYELVRWAGFQWVGYNIIQKAGPVLSLLTFLGVLSMLLFGRFRSYRDLFSYMLWALTLHLLLATTVHPWYILPLLAFLPLVPFRFPLLWSFLVVLSYAAYGNGGDVPTLHLFVEYGLLYAGMGYEVWTQLSGRSGRCSGDNLLHLGAGEKSSS